jgi:hypothetical protein
MRPNAWVLAIDIGLKVALVALLGLALLFPDLPQFAGKAMQGRVLTYGLAMLLVPAIWFWRFRRHPYPVAIDILITLPFFIDVAGNALDLYDTIEWWDDANHLVNWFLHTAAVGLLLRLGSWGHSTRAALAVGWAATTAILWELAEYVAFVPNSPEAATAYADTLGDLALGLLGGAAAAVLVSRLPGNRYASESA